MHYDGLLRGLFPANNPIMKDKKTGKSIAINRKMSKLDIKKLNDMYPCKKPSATCGKLSAFCLSGIHGNRSELVRDFRILVGPDPV